jgi:hypothetical protein
MPDDDAYLLINIEVDNEFDFYPQFPQAAEGGIIIFTSIYLQVYIYNYIFF